MDGSPTVFNVSGRGDETMKSIGLPEGHSSTDLPLVVVVNQVGTMFYSNFCAVTIFKELICEL